MKIWSTTAAILIGLSGVAFAQTSTPSPVPVEDDVLFDCLLYPIN